MNTDEQRAKIKKRLDRCREQEKQNAKSQEQIRQMQRDAKERLERIKLFLSYTHAKIDILKDAAQKSEQAFSDFTSELNQIDHQNKEQ